MNPFSATAAADGPGSSRDNARSLEALVSRYEQALRSSESSFRTLIERNADGVLVVRRDGTICYASPAAEALLGRRSADLLGQMYGTPVIPGESTEVDVVCPDGPRVAEMRAVEISWQGERAYLASLRDITSRKRMEEECRRLVACEQAARGRAEQAEKRAALLAEASKVLAGSLDFRATVARIAHLAVPHLADACAVHLTEDDGAGRLLERAPADHPCWGWDGGGSYGVARVLQTGRPELLPDGPRAGGDIGAAAASSLVVPLQAREKTFGALTLLMTDSGRRFDPSDLALASDLADRIALAIDNARLYQSVREANQRKDEFLSMLAHELRNPLAPIRNSLYLIRLRAAEDPLVAQAQTVAERQTQHLARLVDDLLDVSRIANGKIRLKRERLDLAELVRASVVDYGDALAGAQLTTALDVPPTPVWVEGDATRLTQVVGNLLSNACKFTDQGGQVVVRVGRDEDGRRACVAVRDSGVGIDPDMLAHVFETFTQADRSLDRSRGGLGLGLALVQGLVELHGGRVSAASDGPGRGAEFTFTLPLLEPADRPDAPTASQALARRVGLRLFLIEDNCDAADSLRLLLQLEGHEVGVAYTGPAGVDGAPAFRPDAVICDLGLPGLDGFAVVQDLRRRPETARCHFIALSGYGSESVQQRCREAGFDVHLVKPVDPDRLQEVLANLSARPR